VTPDDFLSWADVLPEPTLLATPAGRLLAANRAVRRLGVAPAELRDRPLDEVAADPPARVAAFLRACSRTTEFVPGALTVRAGGHPVPCRCEGAALRPPAGEPRPTRLLLRLVPKAAAAARFGAPAEQLAALSREVTRRRQVEQELREADRQKTEFLTTLAHELRNPLAPIVNSLHILQTPGIPAQTDAHARRVIGRQVGQMSRLVDDLVDVARLLRNALELRTERVDLAAVVARAVEAARPLAGASGLTLTVALPADPVWLDGDAARLAQVIGILLDNATKYTDPGGRIGLTATVRAAGGRQTVVELRVADTGIGISADALPRIFGAFVHEEQVPGRHVGGLGVGLTLVRRLVELHGGTVSARSAGPGRGSEFTVRLPLREEGRAVP
jgi:signal transduction histidine kinase